MEAPSANAFEGVGLLLNVALFLPYFQTKTNYRRFILFSSLRRAVVAPKNAPSIPRRDAVAGAGQNRVDDVY